MKLSKWRVKELAIVLSFLFLFQSCKVYHKQTVSLDTAITAEKRVKVQLNSEDDFEFYRLIREDNDLFALAKRSSSQTDYLQDKVVDTILIGEKKFVRISLDENEITSIRLLNEKKSKTLSIVVPIVSVIGVLGILIITAANSISFSGSVI